MPFILRLFRRFPMQYSAIYNAGPFQDRGTVWNLSCPGWHLSGDVPMRPGETLSLIVTLPNEQHITVPEAVVRWSRGQEFVVETVMMEGHTEAWLQHHHDVKRLVREQDPVVHGRLWVTEEVL